MEISGNNLPWVEKYRPKTLDDYVLNQDIKAYFKAIVQKKQP